MNKNGILFYSKINVSIIKINNPVKNIHTMKCEKITTIILIPVFLIASSISCAGNVNDKSETGETVSSTPPDYESLKKRVADQQKYFAEIYAPASSDERSDIILNARNYIIETINDSIFTCWYGTPWDFNGTTQIPGKGKIACGYFVTTVLRDVGFSIPRVKWAQITSEVMILKMTTNVKRFRNKPMSELNDYLNQQGDGLYVVGLDCHVGFISKSGKNIRFVHSNYYRPAIGVMSEPLEGKNPLNDSKYRVVGKILDDEMVKNWITGEKYK
jgi:hypothetical protein